MNIRGPGPGSDPVFPDIDPFAPNEKENVNCSYSSDASSAETLADALCTNCGAAKAFQLKEVAVLDGIGFPNDSCSGDDAFLDAPHTMEEAVRAEGHLRTRGSCTSVKEEILKCNTDYSKEHFYTVYNVNLIQVAWFNAIPWAVMALSGYVARAYADYLIKSASSTMEGARKANLETCTRTVKFPQELIAFSYHIARRSTFTPRMPYLRRKE